MTGAIEVPGRPYWAREEPAAVQRIVVEYRFTRDQLEALRGFAPGETKRAMAGSVARALRARKLGEISGKRASGEGLTLQHPQAEFVLNDRGRELADELREASVVIEQVSTNLVRVTAPAPRLRVVSEPAMQTTARRTGTDT